MAFDLARNEGNGNLAIQTLEQHQAWEDDKRQRREQLMTASSTEDEESDEEPGITSTDEREWTAGHSHEETLSLEGQNELSQWIKKFERYIPGYADIPKTLEDLLNWVPKYDNEYSVLEKRVNQAKNDLNRL